MKILVLTMKARVERFTDFDVLPSDWEFVWSDYNKSVEQLLEDGGDAEAILVDAIGRVPAELIERMPNLQIIHSEGVGYEGIDLEAARRRNIYVCNNKGVNSKAVAEQAVLLMLAVLKKTIAGHRLVLEGKQLETNAGWCMAGIPELGDKTVGIIGMGDIGRATTRLVEAFGCDVIYYGRHRLPIEEEEKLEVTYCNLQELLAKSDIVSLHLASTPETQNFMNRERFAQMKPGAVLINTARGEVVDNQALLDALAAGQLSGAGLDTIAPEPVQKDNILLCAPPEILDKITISPHIGGLTEPVFMNIYKTIWSNIAAAVNGETPINVVNR